MHTWISRTLYRFQVIITYIGHRSLRGEKKKKEIVIYDVDLLSLSMTNSFIRHYIITSLYFYMWPVHQMRSGALIRSLEINTKKLYIYCVINIRSHFHKPLSEKKKKEKRYISMVTGEAKRVDRVVGCSTCHEWNKFCVHGFPIYLVIK